MAKSFLPTIFEHPYEIDPKYGKSVAYFCMEYAIDNSFKIYSGGLGYLAGSHMRSAYDLRQNLVGVGILWSYGYYNQIRAEDGSMATQYMRKNYPFLEDHNIKFLIHVCGSPVWVKAYFLNPETFGTAPMFFLSTDLEENDEESRNISRRLYDANGFTRIAQYVLLGKGGARLFDELGIEPEIYHLNEAHGLAAAFHVLAKTGSVEEVRKRFVFTTHTPEEAGNEKMDVNTMNTFSFFDGLSMEQVRAAVGLTDNTFNYTLAALRLCKERGVRTIGIVNVVGSSIAREADATMYTWAGPEISVATTKAYSTQLAACYLLATEFARVRGTLADGQYEHLVTELEALPEKIEKTLADKERIQWFASKYANAKDAFFIGRGLDYAVALEGSLKFKEISYIHSEAFAAGEMKHGPISLVENGTLVVGILTQPDLFEKSASNMVEVKSRGAFLMGLTTYGNYSIEDTAGFTVYVPKTDPHFATSLSVIPLQLLAYYVSCAKGLDVDKPRNLAKSVTVE